MNSLVNQFSELSADKQQQLLEQLKLQQKPTSSGRKARKKRAKKRKYTQPTAQKTNFSFSEPEPKKRSEKEIQRRKAQKQRRKQRILKTQEEQARTLLKSQIDAVENLTRKDLQRIIKNSRKAGQIDKSIKATGSNDELKRKVKDIMKKRGNERISKKFQKQTRFILTIESSRVYTNFPNQKYEQPTRQETRVFNTGLEEAIGKLEEEFKVLAKEADYFIEYIDDWKYEVQQTGYLINQSTPKQNVLMKNAVVLQYDWLRYAKGIDKKSYTDMKSKCVFELLSYLFNNPPAKKPQKTIKYDVKHKTTPEGLYDLVTAYRDINDEQILPIEAGVSTREILFIAKCAKRSMRAFDEFNNVFCSFIQEDTTKSNYCPIVFYCVDEHMYLITDKDVMKQTYEYEKNMKMSSSIVHNQKKESKEDVETFYQKDVDIREALSLPTGVYVLDNVNLCEKFFQFIVLYRSVPKVSTSTQYIDKFCFNNNEGEAVTLSINKNAGLLVNTGELSRVCEKLNIRYNNQGIGYVVNKLIEANHLKNAEENDTFNDVCMSNVNPQVMNIIKSKLFSRWQFVEQVHQKIDNEDEARKIDLVRCRKNILYHSDNKWPVYNVMDEPTPFNENDVIECGNYYIETHQIYPLRGNGWYSQPMVLYALQNNLIRREDIKYKLIPSETLKKDFFRDRVDFLIDSMESDSMKKLAVNSMVGCWGSRNAVEKKYKFTTSSVEAGNYLCHNVDNTFVKKVNLKQYAESLDIENVDFGLYEAMTVNDVVRDNTFYPLYAQVLDIEAIRLHQLEKRIESRGGYILERNTDAILFENISVELDEFRYDDGSQIYREDDPTPLKFEHKPWTPRTDVFRPRFNEWDDLDEEDVIEEVPIDGISIHIDGRAGCGKTYLVNQVLEKMKERKIVKFAPTNKAARGIDGITLHKWLYKSRVNYNAFKAQCQNVDTVVVDEISMMGSEFYQMLLMMKEINPDLQFILVGDFEQLPPINDSFNGNYKTSWVLHYLCDGNRLELTQCRRSDSRLFETCKNVSNVDPNDYEANEQTMLNVSFTHKTRIGVNYECMRIFNKGKATRRFEKIEDDEKSQNVEITVGTALICRMNQLKRNLVKNDYFTVKELKKETVLVENANKEVVEIKDKEFQQFFWVGFCMTIHASQGETFTEKYTIHDWGHMLFTNKMKYVAMSRARTPEQIQIVRA